MYTKAVVYPYNLGSGSAKLLSATLNTKCVRVNGTYRPRPAHLLINWGNSRVPNWFSPSATKQMLNLPQYVAIASHKIRTFEQLEKTMKDHLPEWTTKSAIAKEWLAKSKYSNALNAVVVRTLTQANSGRGIVLAKKPDEIVPAPLYTRYKPKQLEFRIHVSRRFGIIDAQQKRKRNEVEDKTFNQYIRSHDNGWVFCREGVEIPQAVKDVAEEAVHALHLDFGAVDIGYHDKHGITIYEVNTAPGIEGQTLTNYVNMFKKYLNVQAKQAV